MPCLFADHGLCFSHCLVCSESQTYNLLVVPQPSEMEQTMLSCQIITMASSPPDREVTKFFFYAKQVRRNLSVMAKHEIRIKMYMYFCLISWLMLSRCTVKCEVHVNALGICVTDSNMDADVCFVEKIFCAYQSIHGLISVHGF